MTLAQASSPISLIVSDVPRHQQQWSATLPSSMRAQVQVAPSRSTPTTCRRKVTLHRQPARQPTSPSPETSKAPVQKAKAVRFYDTGLEQVRLFLKSQPPCEVRHGDPVMEVELKYPNWPPKTVLIGRRQSSPILMEHVQTAPTTAADGGVTLLGRCRVANLAFEKHIVVRYTTDYWKSFQETEASFRESIGSSANTWDRFTFTIHLPDVTEEMMTVYLALRYTVNDREFWDNNDGLNYQIDVRPYHKTPSDTAYGSDSENKGSRQVKGTADVALGSDPQSLAPHQEPTCQPLPSSAARQSHCDAPQPTLVDPHPLEANVLSVAKPGRKLGHRYDFGASLSAAKKDIKPAVQHFTYHFRRNSPPSPPLHDLSKADPAQKDDLVQYHEFVSKYCFYGNPPSPSLSPCPSPEPICG